MDGNVLGRSGRLPTSEPPHADSANGHGYLSPSDPSYLTENFAALAENASLPMHYKDMYATVPHPSSLSADAPASGNVPNGSPGFDTNDANTSPDDFYRTYSHSAAADSSVATTVTAATTSLPRSRDGRAPLRHPDVDGTLSRSVSTPFNRGGHPGVKQLKRKFDNVGPPTRPYIQQPRANGQFPAGTDKDPAKVLSRPTDDSVSSNAQSFASRLAKSPDSPASQPPSRSASHLPEHGKRRPSTADPPTMAPTMALLFGEVPSQDGNGNLTVGYGIAQRPRRTSESGSRPRLDPNAPGPAVESDSVGRYARGDRGANHQDAADQSENASGAEMDGKLTRDRLRPAHVTPSRTAAARSPTKPPLSASRLPTAARNMASPELPSRTSSRAASPAVLKRPAFNMRAGAPSRGTDTPSAAAAAATTATTPLTPAATLPATPTRRPQRPSISSTTSSIGIESADVGNKGNSSLTAYIAGPPEKPSPPTLRSSRPRPPVSATTAGSRSRAVTTRPGDATGRRKPSESTPVINYAYRRQMIHDKYTRSMRESADALRAQQQKVAAERRRKEMEAADAAEGESSAAAVYTTASHNRKLSLVRSTLESPSINLPGSSPFAPSDDSPISTVSQASSVLTQFDEEPQADIPLPSPLRRQVSIESSHPILRTQTVRSPLGMISAYKSSFSDDGSSEDNAAISPDPDDDDDDDGESDAMANDGGDVLFVSGDFGSLYESEPLSPVETPAAVAAAAGAGTKLTTSRKVSNLSPLSGGSQQPLLLRPPSPGVITPISPVAIEHDLDTTPKPSRSTETKKKSIEQNEEVHESQKSPEVISADSVRRTSWSREPALMDKIALFRQSYDSDISDGMTIEELRSALLQGRASVKDRAPLESSQSLGLPVPSRPPDRLSQNTAWTDFSVNSSIPSYPEPPRSLSAAPILGNHPSSVGAGDEIPSTPDRSVTQASPLNPEAQVSGAGNSGGSGRPSDASPQRRRRPFELDTTQAAAVSYPVPGTVSHPLVPSPKHSPPSVPNRLSGSAFDSRRTSAALEFYEIGLHGSTMIDTAATSEDASLHSDHQSTEQSFTLLSQAPTEPELDSSKASASIELSKGRSEAANKERHRLSQRRLVLKELIDTEAVFVRDMNIVEEIYKGTAEACPELDPQTIKLIFRNTDEIIAFHTHFLAQLKEAAANVYALPAKRPLSVRLDSAASESTMASTDSGTVLAAPTTTTTTTTTMESDDALDRATAIGPVFSANMAKMKAAHEGFLRNSDQAAKRLIQIQKEGRVHIWLKECNEVAKELTTAWNLDSLLIKPMQRITKYPTIMMTLLQHTPADHPDREAILAAKESLETAIIEINQTKKNFELVGQIVGRKRKESDVKAGFARAFGKRVDKLQASSNRPAEDQTYQRLQERFGDDYLRLQVVLRDVEYYTRSVAEWVTSFMNYLSSIELVMRIQAGSYPELESKWVQFNVSMREIEKIALDRHLSQVRRQVIEPFEQVIKSYGNPALAMKKRGKRRVDYEKAEQLKKSGKVPDARLRELVEQYEALNDTLKKELPMLSEKTVKLGHMCLGSFITIQTNWFKLWKDKVKMVLPDTEAVPDAKDILAAYHADFKYIEEHAASIGILNQSKSRSSQSTTQSSTAPSIDENLLRIRGMSSVRGRGLSLPSVGITGDVPPSLPTPDFPKRLSGQFTLSPTGYPGSHQYHVRDNSSSNNSGSHIGTSALAGAIFAATATATATGTSAATASLSPSNGSIHTSGFGRPGTGRSFDSGSQVHARQSFESSQQQQPQQKNQHHQQQQQRQQQQQQQQQQQPSRRDSGSTFNSNHPTTDSSRRYSGLFHSALPSDSITDGSRRSSRASSRERRETYPTLWLAASLFEFNIDTTKHEAGYPYLTYQAGELFDVIAEKGELWLARNQDNPLQGIGWIWSKHFAKLADQ